MDKEPVIKFKFSGGAPAKYPTEKFKEKKRPKLLNQKEIPIYEFLT